MSNEVKSPSQEASEIPHEESKMEPFTSISIIEDVSKNDRNRWFNIRLGLIFQVLSSMTVVMTLGSMFDTYVFLVFDNSNSWVGYLSTLNGVTTLIFAFPSGYLVDNKDKIKIAKGTGILLIVSGIVGIIAIITESPLLLFSYSFLMAICQELGISVMYTFFTEALTAKERLKYFPLRGSLTFLSNTIGPFISILYFLLVSNTWQIDTLKILLIISISFIFPITTIVYFLCRKVDPALISDKPKTKLITVTPSEEATTLSVKDNAQLQDELRLNNLTGIGRHGPLLNLAANFVRGMAAGIFIKYFSLYLITEFQFSPIQVSVSYILLGFAIAIGNFFVKYLANWLGRPLTSFICSILAVICLVLLTVAQVGSLAVFFFVARGFFQNSIRHLDTSYIMDYVASDKRGKYNSILAFSNIAFGGTAFIGGYLSDNFSYNMTFLVTAGVYTSSILLLIPILVSLPEAEKPKKCC